MAVKKIGLGTFGAGLTSNNLEQSASSNCTSDIAELRDSNGEYAGVALYAKRVEYQVEVAVGNSVDAPALGQEGYAGLQGVVTGVTKNYSNSSYQTYSVNITNYNISSCSS